MVEIPQSFLQVISIVESSGLLLQEFCQFVYSSVGLVVYILTIAQIGYHVLLGLILLGESQVGI